MTFANEWPKERLDLDLTLTTGQVFRWRKVGETWEGADGASWFKISESQVETNANVEAFRLLFRLDIDPVQEAADLVACGAEMQRILARFPGLRMMRPTDPVEALFSFLCTSNNHIARISKMVHYLGDTGTRLNESIYSFPSLEVLAHLEESDLRNAGFGYRSATIPVVARQLAQRGSFWISQMRRAYYEDKIVELMSLKGVGPKLADCIALYAFDDPYAAPIDTHLRSALSRVYGIGDTSTSLTAVRYREMGSFLRDRFGHLTARAQQLLFVDDLMHVPMVSPV